MRGPSFRWLLVGLLATLLAGVTLGVRSVRDGTVQMRLSDEAFHRGDVWASTVHARRAALAYVPFAEHTELAFTRLRAAASGAEARGDWRLAQMAYRAMRAAALETSYVHVPRQAELTLANSKLALLQVLNDGSPVDQRDARYQAALRQLTSAHASPFAGFFVLLGLGSVLGLLARWAIRAEGELGQRGAGAA
ncbi:MAG: hypothetical protein SFV15_18750 [Polyangiaceae bacterium]|nr:hypothetical protein [Polyangiaceae bacterium]